MLHVTNAGDNDRDLSLARKKHSYFSTTLLSAILEYPAKPNEWRRSNMITS